MNLFPIIQSRLVAAETRRELYVEVAWDFQAEKPIYRAGEPVLVTGAEAIYVWAWHALKTPRLRHEIFTQDYGNDIDSLIGKPFSDALKQAEAIRYVRECLTINPYITDVTNIVVSADADRLAISCSINTIYGEVSLNV